MDSTRILVMDKGIVAEYDTPAALLAKKDSIFYSLALEAGLVKSGSNTPRSGAMTPVNRSLTPAGRK
jgi:hypothetical protein